MRRYNISGRLTSPKKNSHVTVFSTDDLVVQAVLREEFCVQMWYLMVDHGVLRNGLVPSLSPSTLPIGEWKSGWLKKKLSDEV